LRTPIGGFKRQGASQGRSFKSRELHEGEKGDLGQTCRTEDLGRGEGHYKKVHLYENRHDE